MLNHRYDVVIVGAGGAGLRAALESTGRANTAVLTKLHPTRSGTGSAREGMNAALGNAGEDDWRRHAFDTVNTAEYLADQDAAGIMCREAVDAVLDLERMGLPFSRTPEGRIAQRRFGGHGGASDPGAVPRGCYAGDRTGQQVLTTLYQNCVKRDVRFFAEFHVFDLLLTDGRCGGVVAYELATGDVHVFQAKSVILATGGFGHVFGTTSNAYTTTGDGMAVAYRRGVPLQDLEFFGFEPMVGVDPATEPVPVSPTAHFAVGGIPTDVHARVLADNVNTVPGLYAAGECACVSVHGARSLAGNSLPESMVFGRRAGAAAAEHALLAEWIPLPDRPCAAVESMLSRLINGDGSQSVSGLRAKLRETMDAHARGPRSGEGLRQALSEIRELKRLYPSVCVRDGSRRYNTDLIEAVELGFLLDLARVLVSGALARRESRGAHVRDDYPSRDDVNYLRHTIAYRDTAPDGSSQVRLDYKPVKVVDHRPMERKIR